MYKFLNYTDSKGRQIVLAISTYAGKIVKGKAICNPDDIFNLSTGKNLARARCNLKVATKRRKAITQKYWQAIEELKKAKRRMDKMAKVLSEVSEAENMAYNQLKNLEMK